MKVTQLNLRSAFTLVEIMIVVAIIGLLAAIAIPNFARARKTAQTNACISNLRQMDGAVELWALEAKKKAGDPVDSSSVIGYLKGSNMPPCPAGGTYTFNPVGQSPTCDLASQGHSI